MRGRSESRDDVKYRHVSLFLISFVNIADVQCDHEGQVLGTVESKADNQYYPQSNSRDSTLERRAIKTWYQSHCGNLGFFFPLFLELQYFLYVPRTSGSRPRIYKT